MQRLKEFNQLSQEEAERIQRLRYSSNTIKVLAVLLHLQGGRLKVIMLNELLDVDPAKKRILFSMNLYPDCNLSTHSQEIPKSTEKYAIKVGFEIKNFSKFLLNETKLY